MGIFNIVHHLKHHHIHRIEATLITNRMTEYQGIVNGMVLKIADNAMQQAGEKLGLPQGEIDLAKAGLYESMGDYKGATELYKKAVDALQPFDRAEIERNVNGATNHAMNGIVNATQQQAEEEGEGVKGEKGLNFFQAMARAMGEMLGEKAGKLISSMENMKDAGGEVAKPTGSDMVDDSGELTEKGKTEYKQLREDQAMQFSIAQTEFQADSQMYSMVSQMATTVLKQVGESLSTLARK